MTGELHEDKQNQGVVATGMTSVIFVPPTPPLDFFRRNDV